MQYNYSFKHEEYSVSDIKEAYFLNELCSDATVIENIAITIQALYFYADILRSNQYSSTIEASLCRTITIFSYSVLEAIVISLAKKIQTECKDCRYRQCPYRSDTMFHIQFKTGETEFSNADEYLKKPGILNMSQENQKFYKSFRTSRNNIHLTKKDAQMITQDDKYTKTGCDNSIRFLQELFRCLRDNYRTFISNPRYCKKGL